MLHCRLPSTAAILAIGVPVMLAGFPPPLAGPAAQGTGPTRHAAPAVPSGESSSILLEVDLDTMARERLEAPSDAGPSRPREAGTDEAVEQSAAILRRRLHEAGVAGAVIERDGARRIRVTLPRAGDLGPIRGLLLRRGRMTLHLVVDAPAGRGADTMLLPGEREGRPHAIQRHVEMDGARLADAQAFPDRRTGEWVVQVEFDAEGTKRLAEVTRGAVGRALAIVVDGRVIVAPLILEPILRGQAMISGSFTAREAGQLAILLRSGALPAPLAVVEEAAPWQGPGTRR